MKYRKVIREQAKLSVRIGAGVCMVLLLAVLSGCEQVVDVVENVIASPTPQPTPGPTATNTPVPTVTPTPTATPTPTPTPLPTPMALVVSILAQEDIKLREEPSASAEVVGTLSPGLFVPLHEISDDGAWLKVGLLEIGWVDARLVSLDGRLYINDQSSRERQPLLQSDTAVNVRAGPGLNYRVLGRLPAGRVIGVLETNEDGTWVMISFGNGQGWVSTGTVIVAGGIPTRTPVVTEEVIREP